MMYILKEIWKNKGFTNYSFIQFIVPKMEYMQIKVIQKHKIKL